MSNFTIEDYKEAIRAKYEKDINNPLSDSLTSLSQAYLRDFCWQKFEGGLSEDDLKIFTSFFGFEFNPLKRNLFRDKTDKFRPIGTFLRRQTDLASIEAVNLTAVLVDFQYRPFRKFREKGVVNYLKHPEDSKIPEPFVVKYEDEVKVKEEVKEEVNPAAKTFVGNQVAEIQIKDFAAIKPDLKKEEENKELKQVEVLTIVSQPQSISLFVNVKQKIRETLTKKLWRTAAVVAVVFGFGFGISYYAFPKKQCMQWNNDHYDIVDCDLKIEGIGTYNNIEPLDEKIVGLIKLKACDTTNCFKKDGMAFIWYAKTPNGIDFFNDHGRHPEYNNPLRPVTHYIFNKYLRGKPCK